MSGNYDRTEAELILARHHGNSDAMATKRNEAGLGLLEEFKALDGFCGLEVGPIGKGQCFVAYGKGQAMLFWEHATMKLLPSPGRTGEARPIKLVFNATSLKFETTEPDTSINPTPGSPVIMRSPLALLVEETLRYMTPKA